MALQNQYQEKRFALRLSMRLPIVVSGRTEAGETWSEPTETDDISTTGALFQLNQKVVVGDNLFVRSHRPDGVAVEIVAQVARLAPATFGVARVGVAIEEPKDAWLRLFVAWVADDQPLLDDDEPDEISSINGERARQRANGLNEVLGAF